MEVHYKLQNKSYIFIYEAHTLETYPTMPLEIAREMRFVVGHVLNRVAFFAFCFALLCFLRCLPCVAVRCVGRHTPNLCLNVKLILRRAAAAAVAVPVVVEVGVLLDFVVVVVVVVPVGEETSTSSSAGKDSDDLGEDSKNVLLV